MSQRVDSSVFQGIRPMDYPSVVTFPAPIKEPKGWGWEEILINCPDYCLKRLVFLPGSKGSLHFHARKHETWWVQEGAITLTYVDTRTAEHMTKTLGPGEMVDIPRFCPHQVYSRMGATIVEVSTPHYSDDSYRVAKGDSQST